MKKGTPERRRLAVGAALLVLVASSAGAGAQPAAPAPAPSSLVPPDPCRPVGLYWGSFRKSALVVVSDATATRALNFPVDYGTRLRNLFTRYGYDTTLLRGAQANRRRLIETLRDLQGSQDDLAIVYFSGHGVADPASKKLWLALFGDDPDSLIDYGFEFNALLTAARRRFLGHLVVIVDSCFSGSAIASLIEGGGCAQCGDGRITVVSSNNTSPVPLVELAGGFVTSPFTDAILRKLPDLMTRSPFGVLTTISLENCLDSKDLEPRTFGDQELIAADVDRTLAAQPIANDFLQRALKKFSRKLETDCNNARLLEPNVPPAPACGCLPSLTALLASDHAVPILAAIARGEYGSAASLAGDQAAAVMSADPSSGEDAERRVSLALSAALAHRSAGDLAKARDGYAAVLSGVARWSAHGAPAGKELTRSAALEARRELAWIHLQAGATRDSIAQVAALAAAGSAGDEFFGRYLRVAKARGVPMGQPLERQVLALASPPPIVKPAGGLWRTSWEAAIPIRGDWLKEINEWHVASTPPDSAPPELPPMRPAAEPPPR